jgi:hypothetical protein
VVHPPPLPLPRATPPRPPQLPWAANPLPRPLPWAASYSPDPMALTPSLAMAGQPRFLPPPPPPPDDSCHPSHFALDTAEMDVFVFTEPSSTSMLRILLNFSANASELTLSQGCLPRGNVFV